MESFLFRLFENISGPPAYGVVFGVLVLCGLGLPLPEDVSLILGGFLVFKGKAALPLMMVTGYLGILAGDSIAYTAGWRIGSKVGTTGGFLSRIITPEKRATVQGLFKKHGEKIVMIARFLPGVRAVTYFTAGSVHMKYSHFLFFDGMAALISAPVFVFLGFKFGDELEGLIHAVRQGQTRVLVGLVIVVGGYFLASRLWNRWRTRSQPAIPPATTATTTTPTTETDQLPR